MIYIIFKYLVWVSQPIEKILTTGWMKIPHVVCVEKQELSNLMCIIAHYKACYITPIQILQDMLYPCQQWFIMRGGG